MPTAMQGLGSAASHCRFCLPLNEEVSKHFNQQVGSGRMSLSVRKGIFAVLVVVFALSPIMSVFGGWLAFVSGLIVQIQQFTWFSFYILAKLILATLSLLALVVISLAYFAGGWDGLLRTRRAWWACLCLSFPMWAIDSVQHVVEVNSALHKAGEIHQGGRVPGASWSDHGISIALLALGLVPNVFFLMKLRTAKNKARTHTL